MSRSFSVIVVVLLLTIPWLSAGAATFSAGIENSRWNLSASIFACSLRHPVPGYGVGVFYHRAGEALAFFLAPERNPMRPGKAALVLEQPAWMAGKPVAMLGYVPVGETHERPVEVETPRTRRMMDGLRDGYMPTFTRRARYSDDRIRVRLHPINYDRPYQQFRECQSELLPVNFDQVNRTAILFEIDKSELSREAQKALDKVALFANADERVERIFVDGHADSIGTAIRNRELSEARSEAVTEYLVSRGISEDMIEMRFHGSRYPVAGVETPGPRHRRATVRLERSEDARNEPLISREERESIVIVE